MKFKKHFLIGNPKRKRFSFGYSNFLGDFGLMDLVITIWLLTLIIVFWISFKVVVALISTFAFLLIWIILVKQFGNEKSYDFIFNYFRYRFKFKEILNIDKPNEKMFVLEIISGINLANESENSIQKLIQKLNNFIKNYPSSFKMMKLNSNWELQEHFNFFKQKYEQNKTDILKNLQSNLYDYLYALKDSNLNNRIFLIFPEPNEEEMKLIKSLDLDLDLKECNYEILLALKTNFFTQAKESWNKIETPQKTLIVSKAKFQREVTFGWLIYLFSEPKLSFSLEINSVNPTEKVKLIKKLNKQKTNYRTTNEIEGSKKEWINQANKELLQEVILYNEELKLINLLTIFEENSKQNYQHLELQNRHKSNFKLYRSYFNQQKDWNHFWGWNNGDFPTTNETIANAFPFLNLTYIDQNGFFLGRIEKRYPFVFNSWLLKNQTNLHTIILGNSGSGKTTLMKYLLAGELVLSEQQTIIIDPHNEFTFLKTNAIDLSDTFFNPLFFENINHHNFDEQIQKKIFFLKEFFNLLYYDQLNPLMAQKIQDLLFEIETKLKVNKEVILKGKELRIEDLKINHYLLKPIVSGIYQIFNQTENFNLNKKSIVINLKKLFLMEEQTRNLILFLFIDRLKQIIYSNQNSSTKISIFIDEAAKFLRNKFLLNQISPLFSEARKFNTKITLATQNLVDLFNQGGNQILLANIFTNCSNMFIGYLKNDQRQLLDAFLKEGGSEPLSEQEHQHINKKQGHFLFIKDDKRYSFECLYDKKINNFLKIKN